MKKLSVAILLLPFLGAVAIEQPAHSQVSEIIQANNPSRLALAENQYAAASTLRGRQGSSVLAQVIVMPSSPSASNPELETAKMIIATLNGRSDVRNINFKKDTDGKVAAVCYEQKTTYSELNHDTANHPNAYADGYREGQMNVRKGDKYAARSGGGEFSRGFDDGYYGRTNTGQNASATVRDSYSEKYRWEDKCSTV